MINSFSGGCACGAIRYECSVPAVAMLNCHCRDCQRSSGGACASAVIVPASALVVQGQPQWHALSAESGNTGPARLLLCVRLAGLRRERRFERVQGIKCAGWMTEWVKPMADF